MWEVLVRGILASATLLTIVASAVRGQEPSTVSEFDPSLGVGIELSRRVRLDIFAGREVSDDLGSAKWKFSAGASFRGKPLFPTFLDALDADKSHVFVVGAAYEHSKASDAGGRSIEHKIMLDATGRYAFARRFLVSNRSRFEFRWVNGDYRFRYRNRLMLERTVKLKKIKLSPYIGAEAFWDKKVGKWNQFRYTGGVQIPIIRFTSLDVYFERARCVGCPNQHTNIVGATVNLFFRRK